MIETVSVACPSPPDNDLALNARLSGHARVSDFCGFADTAMICLGRRPVTFETENEHPREGHAWKILPPDCERCSTETKWKLQKVLQCARSYWIALADRRS